MVWIGKIELHCKLFEILNNKTNNEKKKKIEKINVQEKFVIAIAYN